ncbi:phosphatidylserine decarboxylase proenzyme, mitochondrial [Diachasmimorpha longicaudata]|uniref:phosphatidylserine decarboxylase proenzyme, mitochondrial n=1 Tax=Diachasmimorpha longicaudata TaxID=58733 RepID=UPI0030B90878
MSIFRILRGNRHARGVKDRSWESLGKCQEVIVIKRCATTANPENKFGGLWGLTRKWRVSLPIGVGVSLIAVLQWRHLRKYPYAVDGDVIQGPISDLMVECYCCLPLRITSRVFGWFASVELPKGFRPFVFNLYAKTFHADLHEIDADLTSFPSLVDFFVRSLKDDARPIAQNTDIVSPSDGKVLHIGPVTSCRVEQVKGMTYDLRHFLGDTKSPKLGGKINFQKEENDNYVKSLLKNPENKLYQLTVYLAPGDYHRFHSPTDWRIDLRRHFQGKLLSVNPKIASWLPDLFSLNERVVYLGEWSGGFMAYAAVGATNVGSIKVYCDKTLATNKRKWPKGKASEDASLDCVNVKKGELFGEFRMGSTVVLLFEAPEDFQFSVEAGQAIKVGQGLAEGFIEARRKKQIDLGRSVNEAVERIRPVGHVH